VAGILILVINIVGGLFIGAAQHGMSVADAARVFTLLTIGDGLVAQIPSLLLATASAIMVTRVSAAHNMDELVFAQLFEDPRALAVTAVILGIMGAIPGMPNLAFLMMAGAAGYAAWRQQQRQVTAPAEPLDEPPPPPAEDQRELSWDDVVPVDPIGLEIGYRLIPMVDKQQDGQLLKRLRGVRKKLSQEMGFLVPPVHIRDNLELGPNAYRILLTGVTMAEADVFPDRELAINPGQVFGELDGLKCKDPAFGLDAVWIDAGQRERAQTLGYTVVDASTVVATHLNHLMLEHVDELIGHEEVQQLLDKLARSSPKLVEQLVPDAVPLNKLLTVLKGLLAEGVPVRDMRSIAEALTAQAARNAEIPALTAAARAALSRTIYQSIAGTGSSLPVITLEPRVEQMLMKSVQQSQQAGSDTGDMIIEPGLAERLQSSLRDAAQRQEMAGKPIVLLVAAPLRQALARFARPLIRGLHVLSFQEIPDNKQITIEASVG
jgi:flagellar biosynthesis protein FlhA